MPGADWGRWKVHEHFVLRLTGFPFALLDGLATVEAAKRVREACRCSAALQLAREKAFDAVRALPLPDDKTQREQVLALQRATRGEPSRGPRKIPDFLDAETARLFATIEERERESAAARATADAEIARELEEARKTLFALCRRADVRQALFLLNPGAEAIVGPHLGAPSPARNSKARAREHFLVLQLQRLFAKNETNSFFGPVAPGLVAQGRSDFDARLDAEAPAIHRVHVSHWVAQALAEVASRTPEGQLLRRVWANPSALIQGEEVEWEELHKVSPDSWQFSAVRRSTRLPTEAIALVRAAAGQSTVELAALLELSVEDVVELSEELAAAKIVTFEIPVGSGEIDPLGVMRRAFGTGTTDAGREFSAALDQLQSGFKRFETADLADRRQLLVAQGALFQQLTASSPSRNAGKLYADRAVLSEDCRAALEAPRLSPSLLDRNGPALEAICSLSTLRLEIRREVVRAWFEATFPAGKPVPFVVVERAAERDRVLDRPSSAGPAWESMQQVAAYCRQRAVTGAAEARLSSAELMPLMQFNPSASYYLPFDLLLRDSPQGPLLVVGELQYGFFVAHDFFLEPFADDERQRFRQAALELARSLAKGLPMAELVQPHTSRIDLRVPLLDFELLLNAPGSVPQLGADRVLRLADCEVELGPDGFRFLHPRCGPFVPIVRLGCHALLQAMGPVVAAMAYPDHFPPPGMFGADLDLNRPRVLIDEVVISRRSRTFLREELLEGLGESTSDHLAGAERLLVGGGLTQRSFAKIPGERKPILVDAQSPLLLEVFRSLVSRSEAASVIQLSEMLPGAGELVLEGPEGRRTSELRMCFYRPR